MEASLVPVTLLTSCRNNMALPTMKSKLASIEYKIPFTLSSVRKAASAKANVGPVLASMASAWHHAQAAAKVALPAMSAPFCKKSAAETMTPNASNGSEVMATNLKMKDIRPAYQSSRINACHLFIDPPTLMCVSTTLIGSANHANQSINCHSAASRTSSVPCSTRARLIEQSSA